MFFEIDLYYKFSMFKFAKAITDKNAKGNNSKKYLFLNFHHVIYSLSSSSCPSLKLPAVILFEISSFFVQIFKRTITQQEKKNFFRFSPGSQLIILYLLTNFVILFEISWLQKSIMTLLIRDPSSGHLNKCILWDIKIYLTLCRMNSLQSVILILDVQILRKLLVSESYISKQCPDVRCEQSVHLPRLRWWVRISRHVDIYFLNSIFVFFSCFNKWYNRVKSDIFGQTAKFGQPPCLSHSSIIGVKNKLTKQTVKILMRRLIRTHCLQMCVRIDLMSEFTRLYPSAYNKSHHDNRTNQKRWVHE